MKASSSRADPSLFVLLVPGIEGLLSISLVLEDAQQVAIAEGIDGLQEELWRTKKEQGLRDTPRHQKSEILSDRIVTLI